MAPLETVSDATPETKWKAVSVGSATLAAPSASYYAARWFGGAWFLRTWLPSGLRASMVPSG